MRVLGTVSRLVVTVPSDRISDSVRMERPKGAPKYGL